MKNHNKHHHHNQRSYCFSDENSSLLCLTACRHTECKLWFVQANLTCQAASMQAMFGQNRWYVDPVRASPERQET
jgi:hypothetical protein